MGAPAGALVVALSLIVMTLAGGAFAQELIGGACPIGGRSAVSCPVITDEVIREAVTLRLRGAVSSACTPVTVCVQDGVVTLTGVVNSRGKWDLANLLTSTVCGVRAISNQIRLAPVVDADEQLVAGVRQALSRAFFRTGQIAVESSQGIVRLRGMVDSDWDREQAGLIAEGVPGVTAVQNNLIVRYTDRPSF